MQSHPHDHNFDHCSTKLPQCVLGESFPWSVVSLNYGRVQIISLLPSVAALIHSNT